MNASGIALISLVCILALDLAAGAVNLAATGSNTATGVATVQGDVFAESSSDSLYSGAWAHVWVPAGNGGTNSGDSERTVQARTEDRPAGSVNSYTLTTGYGDSTVIAKASKTGVLGTAEAFSEVSALSSATDGSNPNEGEVSGNAQLTAYISHSGTGTAYASAEGSAEYEAMMDNGVVQAAGSVDGSAALDAANSYGGSVTGAAFKASQSSAKTTGLPSDLYPSAGSESFEYLSLESGRNSLSAPSTISGLVTGDASGSGFSSLSGAYDRYASSESSSKGDLSANADTYKLGDSITPGAITTKPAVTALRTQLDAQPAGSTGMVGPAASGRLYNLFLGGTPKASAYLLSQSRSDYTSSGSTHKSFAQSESFTSSGVIRTLADASEAYGASYINDGEISTAAYTSKAAGMSPITLVSAGVGAVSMGSGAHLVSRLTGAAPASTADLTVTSEMTADASTSAEVTVTGDAQNKMVSAVGPSYSPSGTSADATGSYLVAADIDGTAVHIEDSVFNEDSTDASLSIGEADIWSWISGDDPRSHAESSSGPYPIVGDESGPITDTGATTTTRSIDVIFTT
ncbi:MAG TPA: hypothetical protein VN455_14060 [Methanotrichaceae archaeon]|nr:hypothetical protein [Methanotrichaceae archaeon]